MRRARAPVHDGIWSELAVRHSGNDLAVSKSMNETTDEHRAAGPQPKPISPQRRGERGGHPWERTLPACLQCPTLARRMRALPGGRRKILVRLQRIFALVERI